jgi:serine/threonine protein kinase
MPPSLLNEGDLLNDRYRIIRQIGRGGMGAVYEALDTRLGNSVALKQTMVSGDELDRAFAREARLLSALRHSALVVVSDYFVDGEGQFLVMQYIPGEDLATLMARRTEPFPVEQVLDWADQLCDALDYLHTQHPPVIHRDIKPQNLKLTARGEIVLLDFGLAKSITPDGATTGMSLFGYTPLYAPLEQIRATGTDARSDIYALGATIYALLSGTAPANAIDRAAAAVEGRPDPNLPLHEQNPLVSPAVGAVVAQAMALNAAQRPATAAELRQLFQAARGGTMPRPVAFTGPTIVQGSRTEVLPSSASPTEPITSSVRNGVTAAIAFVAVVALLAFGGWGAWAMLGSFARPSGFETPPLNEATTVNNEATIEPLASATSVSQVQITIPTITIPTITIPTIVIPTFVVPTSEASFAKPLLTFGGTGTGTGFFEPPNRIGLDGDGNIFVSDFTNGRIQKFDSTGKFIFSWISEGETPLLAMAITRDGRVMVSRNNGVQVYDGNTGDKLGGFAEGNFEGFNDLIILPDRSMVGVPWAGTAIVRMDSEGTAIERLEDPLGDAGSDSGPAKIASDGLGNLFVLDNSGERVWIFSPEGRYIDRFNVEGGTAFGAIVIDPQGRIFVSAFNQIAVFDQEGTRIGAITNTNAVFDMDFTADGDLLTVNALGQVVLYDL